MVSMSDVWTVFGNWAVLKKAPRNIGVSKIFVFVCYIYPKL